MNKHQSGIMINEFDREFKNKYFQSKYDNIDNVNINQICKTSSLLATSIVELSKYQNISTQKMEANCESFIHSI
jgi:hypothetical protein